MWKRAQRGHERFNRLRHNRAHLTKISSLRYEARCTTGNRSQTSPLETVPRGVPAGSPGWPGRGMYKSAASWSEAAAAS